MTLKTEQWSLIVSVVAVTLSIIVSCALVWLQQRYESKKEARQELTKFKGTMERYVKPLLQCSTELSDRLFKICEEDYLESWCGGDREGDPENFEQWQREQARTQSVPAVERSSRGRLTATLSLPTDRKTP